MSDDQNKTGPRDGSDQGQVENPETDKPKGSQTPKEDNRDQA